MFINTDGNSLGKTVQFYPRIAHLHQPVANFTQYQNGVLYKGTKMYNSLPLYIKKETSNTKKFAEVLKEYLNENAFYTLEEFYKH